MPAEAAMSAKKNRDVAILRRSGRLEALKGTLVHRSVASAGQHGYSLAMAALVVDAAARIRAYFWPMGLCAMVSLTKLGDGFRVVGKVSFSRAVADDPGLRRALPVDFTAAVRSHRRAPALSPDLARGAW
jgi:hypothetical protein